MGAFDGLRIPYDHTVEGEDPAPGPAHYLGNYSNSHAPYLFPWGQKVRNPFFIGPYPSEQLSAVKKTIMLNDISLYDGDTIIDRWVTDEDPETIAESNGYTIIDVEEMSVFVFVTMSV